MTIFFAIYGRWARIFRVLITIIIMASCSSAAGRSEAQEAPKSSPGSNAGYLLPEAIPSSLALLPLPPAQGSAALALDEDISRRSFALRHTPRWELAISDADFRFPHAAGTFSCAMNTAVAEAEAPHLYTLLRRTLIDIGRSASSAKKHYLRPRPFVLNKEPLCTPHHSTSLSKDGSYPSGHSAVGWGWALILSEIAPEQTDAILARGRAFGESRNVCNVHWHSDVMQGRFIAAGVVARLHADPAFQADLGFAKEELAGLRKKGIKPERDCRAEAEALAIQPQLAP